MVKGFKIVGLNSAILLDAMKDRKFKDFEDVIQYYSAKIKTNTIISRNKVDFSSAEKKMNVLNPEEFLRKYTV